MKWLGLAILVVFITPLSLMATPTAKLDLPTPLGYVSDYANILSPQWKSQIRSVCKDLETRTGVEMIVVTLPTVEPLTNAQDYASKLYEGWRIGTAQQERGILLLTSMKERQAVVVLGRTLLSVVSPQKLDQISERHLVPMFRTSAYGEDLYRSSVLLATAAGQTPLPSDKKATSRSAGFWMNLGVVILMLYILWRFTRPERRHPFQRWRRGEYWGTGQGGFGGNFGGFGGGMGGQGLG
ncbi:MAG: TPM domain-containing protein [Nitrospirota bacterium]|nr:MAG: TPM domain-containing protein [Nitrospirota bacterium]